MDDTIANATDKVDEMDNKIDDMDNDFENRFQDLEDEIKDIKDVFHEITASVGDLDRTTQGISYAIKQTDRRLKKKIHNNTLRIYKVEEKVKTLEHQQNEPNLKDIVLPECLEIISNNIGDDWRKLSDLLHLPTEGTSEQQQPHLNMKKCFENARISWKTLKSGLEILNRVDMVEKLKDETSLTYAFTTVIKRHRQKQLKNYEKANAFNPFMRRTTDAPPIQRQREEVFVDLSVVSQNTYIKEYSELENFMERMAENKHNITLEQLVETKDKFVLITGNAGIGKSELIDTVTLKWAEKKLLNGKNGMPNIELLFPIKCRELNTMDFLPTDTFQSVLQRMFPEVFKEITFNDLQDLSHKVMFVVDGLDEMMSIEQLNHPMSIKNVRVQKMVQFVRDVLVSNTKMFPNQYAVAVGRPYISSFIKSLNEHISVKCVYVCGFNKSSVDQYIQRNCDPIIQKKVTREIELSQNLAAMSHVPVYLWVICNIYKDDIAIETPRTTTELMMYACLVFIRRHLIDYEKDVKNLTLSKLCDRKDIMSLIKSISWMSFNSLLQKKMLFENQDLSDIIEDVEELEKKTGFIVKSSNGELGDLYQFTHLVLHELFCGLHMFFSPDVHFSVSIEKNYYEEIMYEENIVRLMLSVCGNEVEGNFENCYPIVTSVEGMILDENSTSALFYFLKRLGDAYDMKVPKGKELMQKLYQVIAQSVHEIQDTKMYLRCCFESNCEFPRHVSSKLFERVARCFDIGSLLELRWYYNFCQKNDWLNVVVNRVGIGFPTEHLYKCDIESLAYLLNIGKSHDYVNGCIQVYEKLVKDMKDNNSKLEGITISTGNFIDEAGIFLVLPYLKHLIFKEIANTEHEEVFTLLINKVNEQYESCKYKLQKLGTYFTDNPDYPDYIEAVCNTMQHLQSLEIVSNDAYTDSDALQTQLLHINQKVKLFSESGRLKLGELRLSVAWSEVIASMITFVDCVRYIPNIVSDNCCLCRFGTPVETTQLWEMVIDEWIDSSGISINEIFGEMKIIVFPNEYFLDEVQRSIIGNFNKKYEGKFTFELGDD